MEDFTILRVIGSGANATVKLAIHERLKKRFALKIYQANKIEGGSIKNKAIEQEILCMQRLNSDYFPKLFASFKTDKGDWVLVQEYVSGQSLYQLLKSKTIKGGMPEPLCKANFKQIAEAVKVLHSCQICHRDLKLENILVNDRGRIKIIDFGFSV
jgi:serine/threonine protein kinase